MISRRRALQLAAGLPWALQACGGPDPLVERALGEEVYRKGADWLWKQQHRDGSFRSDTYGLLKGGASITAFVLLHAQVLPRDDFAFPRAAALRASEWLLRQVGKTGVIGLSGDVPDYPVYATAMTVHAMWRLRPKHVADNSAPLLWWLRRQQLTAANGWEGHRAQGGFPMGSAEPPSPRGPTPHVDLSMTRVAVQAMASVGIHANDPAMVEARGFVERCRRADGTYVYSPAIPALNKGEGDSGYGSATADALQVLVANRMSVEELQPHVEPLRAMHRLDANPRIGSGPRQIYAEAMRYYYRCGAAAVFEWAGGPTGWADDLIRSLAAEQDRDGSWRNPAQAQKEDDPLVATGLALSALGAALRSTDPPERGPRI